MEFDDGKHSIVDFSKYFGKEGVFDRFKDIEFFRGFSVNDELGSLTWGNEVDVAQETLCAAATGSDLPSWMEIDKDQMANHPLDSEPSQAHPR